MKYRRSYEPRIVGGKVVMMPAELQRLHRYVLDTDVIEVISDEMREVVEAELAGGRADRRERVVVRVGLRAQQRELARQLGVCLGAREPEQSTHLGERRAAGGHDGGELGVGPGPPPHGSLRSSPAACWRRSHWTVPSLPPPLG